MNFNSLFIDKLAISISGLCVAHCLLFPVLVALLPSLLSLGIDPEIFHQWMIIFVIPTSVFALTLGCKKHGDFVIVTTGILGLSCLILAFALGANLLGEIGEKLLTLIGGLIIAYAHFNNYKSCQHHDKCAH